MDKAMIIASLSSLMALMSSDGTSSLTTSSLGKPVVGGVTSKLVICSGLIEGMVLLTVGTEDASEAAKLGEDSAPL